jgi:hypothetical protein
MEEKNNKLVGYIIYIVIIFFCVKFLFFKEDYEDYEKFGANKVKWEKCWNSFIDDMVDDIEDGVWDDGVSDSWYYEKNHILDYVDKNLGDEELKYEINEMLRKKINNLNKEYPNIEGVREKVMYKLKLEWQ